MQKQGVSLVMLAITIIVMVILAGTIMISLSDSGIINKAKSVVDATNLKTVQEVANMAWGKAYIDNMPVQNNEIKLKNMREAVNVALANGGIETDKYTIIVSTSGVTVKIAPPADWRKSVWEVTEDGVPIPIGFVKSPYAGEGSKNTGLVIYALTETEIANGVTMISETHERALETRNQFVWVPVDSTEFKELFVRQNFSMSYSLSTTLGTNYWELLLNNDNTLSSTQNSAYISDATLKEATEMYDSVKKYGGFYIARYEVGSDEAFEDTADGYIATRATKNDISNLSVTMGKYPYSKISWGESMNVETSDDGAVSLARSFYPADKTIYGVVSTLTYGVQWDRTLAWWKESNSSINLTSSTSYGVYKDTKIANNELNANAKCSIYASSKYGSWETITEKTTDGSWLLTTGAYKKANVYNIYDMAGNLYEWTMEGNSTSKHVLRGGFMNNTGSGRPVAYRYPIAPTGAYDIYGFRPSLYIK